MYNRFFSVKTNFHQPQLLQLFFTTEKPAVARRQLHDDTLLTPKEERMELMWQAYRAAAKQGQTVQKPSHLDFVARMKKTETNFTENVRLNNHIYSRSIKIRNSTALFLDYMATNEGLFARNVIQPKNIL